MRARAAKKKTDRTELLLQARRSLLAKRAELRAQLKPQSAGPERVAEEDQARVLHDQFVTSHLERLALEQLRMVEAALRKLDSGEYGVCMDCESEIAPKRLEAIPWAPRCLNCQEEASSRHEEEDEYTGRAA